MKKEDFQVFEDDIEQEITLFEMSENPITIFLLLDVSGSMMQDLIQLTEAANAFVNQLRADDKLLAATFDEQIYLLFNAKSVKEIREMKKIHLKTNGLSTMVYDATEYAIKKMRKISGRKAIILFSDGVGGGYLSSAKSNLQDAEESEALIYTIRFDTAPKIRINHESDKDFRKRLERDEFGERYMKDLAQISGGRNYQIEKILDLEKTFQEIVDELNQQYNLGYYPKKEGKKGERRQIKVKVSQPNLAVRARSSYVIGQKK
jgi:VWFA-related protein